MNRWLWCATAAMCVLLIGAPAAAQMRGATAEDYFAFETKMRGSTTDVKSSC